MAGHERVIAADGKEMPVAAHGLFGRAIALLLDSEVDALVLVVQTDELLRTGLPVDRINRVVETAGAAAAPWLRGMRELIARYRTEAM
jgi:cyanophycin synthetase